MSALRSGRPPTAMARAFLALLSQLDAGQITVVMPNGSQQLFTGSTPGPQATLIINDWTACSSILNGGDIGVAEAYRDQKIDTPDLLALLLVALANQGALEKALNGSFWGTFLYRIRHWLNRNTRHGSQKNIHAHYDIGNTFYRLWLDHSMTYSAGIFTAHNTSLNAAQSAKYDRVLDLLNVQPGHRILEIGCGWGGFAERAALRGCYVHGISLSTAQLEWARAKFKGSALEPYIRLDYQDYRDISGQYDAIVSIEMIEAVGQAYWPTYFKKIHHSLKPGGRAAIQAITIADDLFASYQRGTDFIQQYIFPGGMLPSPETLAHQTACAGLRIEDRYCFGLDYARTLQHWREGFEREIESIRTQGFDEAFIRLWRFYFCYCEAGFLTRRTDVCQLIMQAS